MADIEYRNDGLHVNSALETQGVRQETIDNPEFIQVTIDSSRRIIEAIRNDGKKVFYTDVIFPNGFPEDIKKYIDEQLHSDIDIRLTQQYPNECTNIQIIKDSNNKINTIYYYKNSSLIRTDSFVYNTFAIIETRTINAEPDGKSTMIIETNTSTLNQVITYN